MNIKILIFSFLLVPFWASSMERLPFVQRLGPLFSFGQHLLKKNSASSNTTIQALDANHENVTLLTQTFYYGVTNNLVIDFKIPWAKRSSYKGEIRRQRQNKGLSDVSIDIEYGIINKITERYARRWTVVGAVFFPTSDFNSALLQDLFIGQGSYNYFLGTTLSNVTPEWYTFFSLGSILPAKTKTVHFGARIFYEAGFGRTFINIPNGYLALILELDGIKEFRGFHEDTLQRMEPRNTIFLGPVLRFSYLNYLFRVGFQEVVFQKVAPGDKKTKFRVGASMAIGFKF